MPESGASLDSPTMLASDTSRAGQAASPGHTPPIAPDWKRIVQPVEPFLERVAQCLADQLGRFDPEIAGYAEYALANSGKQLRPSLVALSGSAVGELADEHVRVAAIIEMVHLATLVHDDIMDGAELRRSRPTLAANWGSEISVLLGDCLFAHALEMAASFPTTEVCWAVSKATKTVCTGEILQTQRRGKLDLTRGEYRRMLEMKTAELFALSCELGAGLAGATAPVRAGMRAYGLALGTAYQIYDDCVDLFGRESAAGKSLGTDLTKGKLTLPVLVAIERAEGGEGQRLHQMINQWHPGLLPELVRLLARLGALEETQSEIARLLHGARLALAPVAASPSREALLRLNEMLAHEAAGISAAHPRG